MNVDESLVLSLEELSERVGALLQECALIGKQQDHRVSAVPDARTIRYYTTLGLIDRPKIEGRQAKYGKRHLLQLLAIKALQVQNLPLAEIQARLFGRSEAELEQLLDALAEVGKERSKRETLRPVLWKELILEPGLKILVQENWIPQDKVDELEARVAQIVRTLAEQARPNGGTFHD